MILFNLIIRAIRWSWFWSRITWCWSRLRNHRLAEQTLIQFGVAQSGGLDIFSLGLVNADEFLGVNSVVVRLALLCRIRCVSRQLIEDFGVIKSLQGK